jgi:coenzyme Q-binding protein COQ10
MPVHSIEKQLPFTAKELYDLVADIESYPSFLPWCSSARILERENNVVLADLMIDFKGVHGKYTSRVILDEEAGEISVELAQGPFKHLYQGWKFIPCHQSTLVEFDIDFSMRSKIMEKIVDMVFESMCAKMMNAFEQQAHKRYRPVV